jgi:hypothetical protein
MSASHEPAIDAFPIGGPTTKAWREQSLTRIAEVHRRADLLLGRRKRDAAANPLTEAHEVAAAAALTRTIHGHLDEARDAAKGAGPSGVGHLRSWIGGASLERAASNLDAAEADLLALAPLPDLRAQMPNVMAHVRRHLNPDDPRRVRVEAINDRGDPPPLDEVDRGTVVGAARAASSEGRREVVRVRSFRNVLLITAGLLSLAAGGVVILGIVNPDVIPLCFQPGERVVCPTGETPLAGGGGVEAVTRQTTSSWDLPLIELVGLIAAAVVAAASVSGIKGTSIPYSLPVALSLLKLPTGALTAVLGLLLMRGEFIPGLSALDSSGQIVAWAVFFGAAQHAFTRLVDQQAQTILEGVGSPTGPSPASSAPQPAP